MHCSRELELPKCIEKGKVRVLILMTFKSHYGGAPALQRFLLLLVLLM